MAAERVAREQKDVDQHDHSAESDAEPAIEVEGENRVVPEEPDLDHGRVEREAVEVVEHPGECGHDERRVQPVRKGAVWVADRVPARAGWAGSLFGNSHGRWY